MIRYAGTKLGEIFSSITCDCGCTVWMYTTTSEPQSKSSIATKSRIVAAARRFDLRSDIVSVRCSACSRASTCTHQVERLDISSER